MENLYKFYWNCGRQGKLEGIFLATQKDVDSTIGKELYFGEVLGKHSEIYGKLENGEVVLITDNQEFLQMAKDLNINLAIGFNPLENIREK